MLRNRIAIRITGKSGHRCITTLSTSLILRRRVSDGSTPTEVGCTTTSGFFAYVYSDYTTAGSNFVPISRSSPIPQTASPTATATSSSETAETATSSKESGGLGASQQTAGSGSSITSNSETTTNDNSSDGDSSGNSVPVGAIAGGVVGGVAVLAIAAGIITWMCLRHRREKRNNINSTDAGMPATSAKSAPPVEGPVVRKPVPGNGLIDGNGTAELAHDQNYRPHEVLSSDRTDAHELSGRRAVPELP